MTLTRDQLQSVLGAAQATILGAVVQQVRVPDHERLLLSLRQPGATHWLLLCAAPRVGRIHLVAGPPPNPREALAFQGLLRKELKGTVSALEVLEGERLVRLTIGGSWGKRRLVLELYGGGGNIVLLDEQDRVLGRAGSPRRPGSTAARGEVWRPPAGAGEWVSVSAIPSGSHGDLAAHYAALEETLREAGATDLIRRRLRGRRKELRRLAKRQERDLARVGAADALRRRAELLQGSFHLLSKGAAAVSVIDWAADGQPKVEVEVDPRLEPSELVEDAFRRARRAERAQIEGQRRLAATRDSLSEVEELEEMLTSDPESAHQLADELLPAAKRQRQGRRQAGPRRPYVPWRTPSGHELRVGRGAADNDQLTFRHSKGNDVWLHVRGRPGAHVVIRDPGTSPSPELLLLAAQLTLVKSGLSVGDREEVTWTRVKHVSKPKGSKPGSVVPRQGKVLYVEVERDALDVLTRE